MGALAAVTDSAVPYTRMDVCKRSLETVRHSRMLGLEVLSAEEEGVRLRLPWREDLVGNPDTGVLHGGAVFALMDHAGGMANSCRLYPAVEITPTIDLRIDHLHAPTPGKAVICDATCYRLSAHVTFVRMTAWEEGDEQGEPVATGQATYTRMKLERSGRVAS